MPRTMASRAAIVLACVFAALLSSAATNFDFRSFYCAGQISQQHGNVYTTEPLRGCERALPGDPFKPFSAKTALPAPLPGYSVALFQVFARAPYPVAARLWTALLVLAIIVAVFCAVRLTGISYAAAASVFVLSLGAGSLGLGEVVPVFVAALAVAAVLAEKNLWVGAAAAVCAAMMEPHLGLPVAISLAVWAPRARIPLAAGFACLSAVSILTLGADRSFEYVFQVLPLHALSELGSDAQLSLSVVMYSLGSSVHAAIAAGAVSYVLAGAAGVAIAGILARRYQSNAFIVVTPAAFSLIGGTFIHVTQMAAALPFVLLLWSRAPQYRGIILPACLLLAVPWRVVGGPLLITAAIAVVLYLTWELSARNLRATATSGGLTLALLLTLNVWMTAPPLHHPVTEHYSAAIPATYAEASWAQYNEQYLSTASPERWWRRVPTWAGLILAATAGIALVRVKSSFPDWLDGSAARA